MTTTHRPLTAEQAYPPAMALLIELGDAIGDRDGIRAALDALFDEHPHDWPRIAVSALAWTFAAHARLDPNPPRQEMHS